MRIKKPLKLRVGTTVDEVTIGRDELVHLTTFGVSGDSRQFSASARRLARKLKRAGSDIGDELLSIISDSTSHGSEMRRAPTETAPSARQKSDLLIETPEVQVAAPSLPGELQMQVDRLIAEQRQRRKLEKAGLMPMRTGLFVGPPGVGKTMTAHWIAQELKRPIYTLNLAATVSSLFGKTGANVREAIDFAQAKPSVLLLDEFDAIAKGRNEEDIGEAKRVVTVLLQQLDQWPSHSVLLAATNHGELLDRAIWRRFDLRLDFPTASVETAIVAAKTAFGDDDNGELATLVSELMEGRPLSDVVDVVLNARKRALLFGEPLEQTVLRSINEVGGVRSRKASLKLALALVAKGHSQRHASELTGVSRDTLRKNLRGQANGAD